MSKKSNPYKNKFEQMLAYKLEKQVFKALLDHIAEGHSVDNFYFTTDGFRIAYYSLESHIKSNPEIFPKEEIEFAKAQGHKKWEKIIFDAALGKHQGTNPLLLQLVMRNKYKWDSKEEEKSKEPIHVSVNMMPKKR